MFTAEARSAQRKAGEILHPLSRVQDDDACPMVGNPQRRATSGLCHVANREIGFPRKGNGLPRRRGRKEKQIEAATGLTSWQAGAQQAAPLPLSHGCCWWYENRIAQARLPACGGQANATGLH